MDFDAKKIILVCFSLISLGSLSVCGADSSALISLISADHAQSVVRVKTLVEASGSLRLKSGDEQITSIPLKVDAEMFYDERGREGADLPSVRHYWKADANLTVGGKEHRRALRTDRRFIRLSGSTRQDRITSPHGPLTRDELDLLDVAGNGFPPEQLLPARQVKIGDTWSHDNATTAQLLRLDNIDEGQLESQLKEVDGSHAKIDLRGKVGAKVNGIATQVEVIGAYQFDLTSQSISWFSLSVKEQREVSLATPGFDVVSRIRIARKRVESSEALTTSLMDKLDLTPGAGDQLLEFRSEDERYRVAIDRRWYLISQRDSLAVMRLVDNGDLIATCKMNGLHRLAPGTEMTLFGFQKDVQRALDRYCEEIITSGETVSPQGIRTLRVEAGGKVEETPVRWVYYHLSNDQGDRLSSIFTYEASRAERFAGTDESLTSSVQFLDAVAAQARLTSETAVK